MRASGARDWIFVTLLILASVFLGKIQTNAKQKGGVDPVSSAVHAISNPGASMVTSAVNGVSDFFRGVFSGPAVVARNRELEALARASSLYSENLSRLEREIDGLRKALAMPPLAGKARVPADVIGFAPAEYRITISAGKKQGVRPGCPVVTPDGLLGVVQLVEATTSQVTLIYSPTLKIGAVAQRNPPPAGLLRGESAEKLLVEFVDLDAPAQVGDLITTSGFSNKIPGGIPIGKIVQIANDKDFGTRRAQVFPNVQIGSVREVFVLK